jgi:hypothetical protein
MNIRITALEKRLRRIETALTSETKSKRSTGRSWRYLSFLKKEVAACNSTLAELKWLCK